MILNHTAENSSGQSALIDNYVCTLYIAEHNSVDLDALKYTKRMFQTFQMKIKEKMY